MTPELEMLSRWQFGITAATHIVFPAISVGLSCWLFYWYAKYLKTNDETYLKLHNYWKKVFAVGFGLGVVTGTMMTFEFGINWARYAHAVGPILGVIISMEVITAFFLEAGFIGIFLFGSNKVSKKMMLFSNGMVALGTILSMTWILSANSWMQTPGGYLIKDGQFLAQDWMKVIFNVSFAYRLIHIMLGFALASSLLVNGVAAYNLLKKRNVEVFRKSFNQSMIVLTTVVAFQFWFGDQTVFKVGLDGGQMGKLLALEGHFTGNSTSWYLAINADQEHQVNKWVLGIPKLGGLLVNNDINKPIPSITTVSIDKQPDVNFIFYTFRVMFFIVIAIFCMAFAGLFARFRGNFFTSRFLHKFALWMTPMGFIAVICGWLTAEVGRQPFVVYGLLRTDQAYSLLQSSFVKTSLFFILLIYGVMLFYYIRFVLKHIKLGIPATTTLAAPGNSTSINHQNS